MALVYIVDDDPGFRNAISRLLRAVGYDVAVYDSAEELLARLSEGGEPGCILVDVLMPGLSGPEVQQYLTKIGSALPIIFVTGSAEAVETGGRSFLKKPVSKEKLVDAIQGALSSMRATKSRPSDATVRTDSDDGTRAGSMVALGGRAEATACERSGQLDKIVPGGFSPGVAVVDRFIARENTKHLRGQLGSEIDPKKRSVLTKVLVEEEDKLGADYELLADLDRHIRKGHELIARQSTLVAKMEHGGHDGVAQARMLLDCLIESQNLLGRRESVVGHRDGQKTLSLPLAPVRRPDLDPPLRRGIDPTVLGTTAREDQRVRLGRRRWS
jgi:CheY-like chemotaxis protein